MLVLGIKGQDSQESKAKRDFLAEWVNAVSQHGGFRYWTWAASYHPKDVARILKVKGAIATSPLRSRAKNSPWPDWTAFEQPGRS